MLSGKVAFFLLDVILDALAKRKPRLFLFQPIRTWWFGLLIYSLRKPLWQGIILTCFAFSRQAFVAGYCLCFDLVPEWLLAICNLSAPGLDGLHVPSSAANEVRRYSTNAGWILDKGNGFERIAANPPGREDIWSSAFPLLAVPCQTRNIFGVFLLKQPPLNVVWYFSIWQACKILKELASRWHSVQVVVTRGFFFASWIWNYA